MPKAQQELDEIHKYLAAWIAEITVSNALTYYDINKVSEGTSLYLLNLLFNWKQEDLNNRQQNFPGIDLGDMEVAKLAVQVSSRTDTQKIKSTLLTFLERDYLKSFPNGLRFLLLSDQKRPVLMDNFLAPYRHFFDPKNHIILLRDLLLQVKKLYYEDQPRFDDVRQFLAGEFGPQAIRRKNGLISFRNSKDKVGFFKQLFAANQDSFTRHFVPVEYSANGLTFLSDNLLRENWTNDGLIIYGPSGCGKSALARQLALTRFDQVFPVVLEAKYYESSLQDLFEKEVRAYGFDSDGSFLACAARYNQGVLLIIDGLNECKVHLRPKLILETRKAVNDKHLKTIITTQVQEAALQEFGFDEVCVQQPSPDIRQAIASAYGKASEMKKLNPILTLVTTALEAKMVGEIDSNVIAANSRFLLFEVFIKQKLNDGYTGGFLLMALVARSMSDKITFSLSSRSVETMLLGQGLPPGAYQLCLKSGILEERSGRVSFAHEMFFNFFVAESVARFAANSGEIITAVNAPKNADKKLLIIGAVDDTKLLNEVLSGLDDPNVFDALMDGEGGEYCRLWVNRQLMELLPRIAAEVGNCEFEFAETPHHFQCKEDGLTAWKEHDLALLYAIPGTLAKGELLEQVLEITGSMDDICAHAVTRFWDEAKARNISARSNIFLAAYNGMWQGKLAIGRLFSSLNSGFSSQRGSVKITFEKLEEIISRKPLKPGQVYLLLLVFRWDDRLQALYPTVLTILQKWRQAPFHLISEILQQIGHLYVDEAQKDELVHAIHKMHSETQNAWLSTMIFDALSALGELEQDAHEYITVVNAEIVTALAKPTDQDACEAAASIFFRQYDHPYDFAYYTAINQLPAAEKTLFFEMALQGGYSSMNTIALILRAYTELGTSSVKYLVKWTETPFVDPAFPSDSLGIFLVAHLLLGKSNYSLPAYPIPTDDKKENSIRALAEAYYWLSRTDLENEQAILKIKPMTDVLFAPENTYVIETIWQSKQALLHQTHYGELDLTILKTFEQRYRDRITSLCRHALQNLTWQESIRQFAERTEEMNQHAISLLTAVGSVVDSDVLRPLTDDVNYGRHAVDAIKSLGG